MILGHRRPTKSQPIGLIRGWTGCPLAAQCEVPDSGHRAGVVRVKDCPHASDGGRPARRRGTGRGPGAGHVRQPRDRVHDRPYRTRTRRRGTDHRGRAAARRADRRVPAPARPLVVPPEVRPAVRGGFLRHGAARHRRRHPEVPRLGPDQGHRPGHGRTHGRAFRRGHHARHRRRAGPPDRGGRAGPQAHREDRRRLGRAEGHQGGDDLPPGRRGLDVAGGADLQEIRRRVGPGRPRRAVPAGRRRVGDRVQDRRHDRHVGRHRPGQPGADQGRPGLHPVRGRRRRALLPARAQPDRRRRQDPRRPRRPDHPVPGRARRRRRGGPRTGARGGPARPGAGRTAGPRRLPAAVLSGRTVPGARTPAPARRPRRPPQRVRRRRLGQGTGLAARPDRLGTRPGTSRRGPARPDRQGRGPDRRPRLRQILHRPLRRGTSPRQRRQDRAGRPHRPGRQAARRTQPATKRPPSTACCSYARAATPLSTRTSHWTRTWWSSTRPRWWT